MRDGGAGGGSARFRIGPAVQSPHNAPQGRRHRVPAPLRVTALSRFRCYQTKRGKMVTYVFADETPELS